MDLFEEFINVIEKDNIHLYLKEDLYKADDALRCVVALLMYLDVYDSVRKKLTYDNVDDVLCRVLEHFRPEVDLGDLSLITYVLKDGGFLFKNLRMKDDRRCFYVAY